MASISTPLPELSDENLTLFYTTDPNLSNAPILIFHGPSTTTNATQSSSRIQAHVFTPAGFQSYPRITISPGSPLYAAVNHLPREKQGDEVCRGLAVSLLKYFSEMPTNVSETLSKASSIRGARKDGYPIPKIFDEMHAGELASRMEKVEHKAEVVRALEAAFVQRSIGHIDLDLVLPPGSIDDRATRESSPEESSEVQSDEERSLRRYGAYAPLISLFGESAFLPTSKIRRAPSKPTALSRSRSFLKDQKEAVRLQMSELVDTETRYVDKLEDLVMNVAEDFRQRAKVKNDGSASPDGKALESLFPPCLDQILEVNMGFLEAITRLLDDTEEEAMAALEKEIKESGSMTSRTGPIPTAKDATGLLPFSKILLEWFPQFRDCYVEYLKASGDFPTILSNFLKSGGSSFSSRIQETGEQRIRSMLIEPVQRLPRYSLYIDGMVNNLPHTHPALPSLLKARDIITDICSLDKDVASEQTRTITRLQSLTLGWPASLKPKGRLIEVADFTELQAPYYLDSQSEGATGIFVLFAECLAVLHRVPGCKLSAKGLQAEVDRPSALTMQATMVNAGGQSPTRPAQELKFIGWLPLDDLRFADASSGRLAWMTSTSDFRDSCVGINSRGSGASVRVYQLGGVYEGKASKWSEVVTKSRVEGRFPEKQRENPKWSLRHVRGTTGTQESVELWSAVFEEGEEDEVRASGTSWESMRGGSQSALVRVVVDSSKGASILTVGEDGVEISASVALDENGKFLLEIDGLNDFASVDNVSMQDFLPVLINRRK
jgi:RhoGEF domain/Domain of unknown function (DUF3507)